MSTAVSSANPEELFRYADTGATINYRLIAEARPLTYALERFIATCREPYVNDASVKVDVDLADELRTYGHCAAEVDEAVRAVGQRFNLADTGYFRANVSALVVPDLLPDWDGLGDRLLNDGRRLLEQGPHVAWRVLQHAQPIVSDLVEGVRSFRDSVRERVRYWCRRVDVWQQRTWEKLKSFESPLLKFLPKGLQDFLRSAQRFEVSVLEWQANTSLNIIWGFIWGEPLFDEVWGAGILAFIGDFLGGLIFWSDIRDMYKYSFFKPFVLGDGSFPENLPYVLIAAAGLIPGFGDALKLFKKPLGRWLAPSFERLWNKVWGEILSRIAKRKLSKLVGAPTAEKLIKELGSEEAEKLVKQLQEARLSGAQIQNLVEELGAKEVKALSDTFADDPAIIKDLLKDGLTPADFTDLGALVRNYQARNQGEEALNILQDYGGRLGTHILNSYELIHDIPGSEDILKKLAQEGPKARNGAVNKMNGALGELAYASSLRRNGTDIERVADRIQSLESPNRIVDGGDIILRDRVVDVKNYDWSKRLYSSRGGIQKKMKELEEQIRLHNERYPGRTIELAFTNYDNMQPQFKQALLERVAKLKKELGVDIKITSVPEL